MKIVIETKYNIGDIVYAYWNGRFTEFKIQNIVINHYDYKYRPEIEYICVLPERELVCQEHFRECELLTADDIVKLLESFKQ